MLRKTVGFGVLALAGAALVPSATVEAGGIGGAFAAHPSYGIHFSGPAGILLQPHAGPRMRPPHLGSPHRLGNGPRFGANPAGAQQRGAEARLPFAPRLPPQVRHENPYSHVPRGHHRILFGGLSYPLTTGEDWGYVGSPYNSVATLPAYAPPAILDVSDPPAPQAMPRLSSSRDEAQDACRSERVTVPAHEGDREITIVRC